MQTETRKRKPHNDLAGYLFERKFKNGHLACYIADEAGIDCEDKYVAVYHSPDAGHIGPSFTSLPKARAFVKDCLEAPDDYDWAEAAQ
ncbi:MAG: hypothetical protein NXI17_05885 [Alphaproteobacteria bacterium]|nr:hypothetical protein [Alphaproteobacteria bacterium]